MCSSPETCWTEHMGHQARPNISASPGCCKSEHDEHKRLFSGTWFSWDPWRSCTAWSFYSSDPQPVWTHPWTSSRLDIVHRALACNCYCFQPNVLNEWFPNRKLSTNKHSTLRGETCKKKRKYYNLRIKQVSAQRNLTSHWIPQRLRAAASMHPHAARAHSIPEKRVMTFCGARSRSCTYCVPK